MSHAVNLHLLSDKARAEIAAGRGTKDDFEKPDLSLLPFDALAEVARVMEAGRRKYGASNWRKGMQWTRCASAALRHIGAWLSGETNDSETGCNHMAHAACMALFLVAYSRSHPHLDDRCVKPVAPDDGA